MGCARGCSRSIGRGHRGVGWAIARERLEAGVEERGSEASGEHHEPLGRSGRRCMGGCASHVCSPRSRVEGLARWPRWLDSSPTLAPQGVLAARRPLVGGTRSPSVSSRCTNLYSVMTGLESDPPSSSTPRFRDPSSPCMGKDRMKLLRAQELAVTNSGAGRVEHRMMAVHERLVSGPAAPRSTAFRHGPASQLQSPDRSLGLGAAAGGRQLRTGGCLGPRRTHRQAVG